MTYDFSALPDTKMVHLLTRILQNAKEDPHYLKTSPAAQEAMREGHKRVLLATTAR